MPFWVFIEDYSVAENLFTERFSNSSYIFEISEINFCDISILKTFILLYLRNEYQFTLPIVLSERRNNYWVKASCCLFHRLYWMYLIYILHPYMLSYSLLIFVVRCKNNSLKRCVNFWILSLKPNKITDWHNDKTFDVKDCHVVCGLTRHKTMSHLKK